ncbi:MAG: galactokinase, partial [Clostridia bacterium]|nr:galactokinase [Clostridia bacterium]
DSSRRFDNAVRSFVKLFGEEKRDLFLFSAPGRTEICGNHTDHQHGCVLAAAVNIDAVAVAALRTDNYVVLESEGYGRVQINTDDCGAYCEEYSAEKGTTAALIRGMISGFKERGIEVKGFDAYVTSEVLSGSGLSSSAAFEILVGNIINKFSNANLNATEIAIIGQKSENLFFGKASGLMDQMVSSVGGMVYIDFSDPSLPIVEKYDADFEEAGLKIIVTDTHGSHADLTDDYSAVPSEMRTVASVFGCDYLNEVDEKIFYDALYGGDLRDKVSDRAILRAVHFFEDNKRVHDEVDAIKKKDFKRFLELVNASGKSSALLLQNLYSTRDSSTQAIPLALMMSERILGNRGACRVHGGGFAGTIQAFVPNDLTDEYIAKMNSVFGENSCMVLNIRNIGGCCIK